MIKVHVIDSQSSISLGSKLNLRIKQRCTKAGTVDKISHYSLPELYVYGDKDEEVIIQKRHGIILLIDLGNNIGNLLLKNDIHNQNFSIDNLPPTITSMILTENVIPFNMNTEIVISDISIQVIDNRNGKILTLSISTY